MAALNTRSIGPYGPHFRRFPALLRLAPTCRVPYIAFSGPSYIPSTPGFSSPMRLLWNKYCKGPTCRFPVNYRVVGPPNRMFFRFLTPLALAACTAVSVLPAVSCGPVSADLSPRTPAGGIDVQALAESLSENAQVYVPSDEPFAALTVRWSNLEPPTPNVVVVAAIEQDVSQTVSSPLSASFSFLHTKQPANNVCNRLPSRITTVSPFLLTMGTMALSSHWERWTTAFKFTSASSTPWKLPKTERP